jgi:hypothetical protein
MGAETFNFKHPSGDVPKAEPDATPARAARNRAPGRPRDPTVRHYDRSARSSLH